MTNNLLYRFPRLYPGILLKRYERFCADVELNTGEKITAHCPNTGPMTGLLNPHVPVQVSYSDNPDRRFPHTLELIQVNEHNQKPVWVGVNTALPNRVVKLALSNHLFPELGEYGNVRSEVIYGQYNKSRVDFFLTSKNGSKQIFLEVKNTTLAQGNVAIFPDTVTTRGQKHLRELMTLAPNVRGVMLYFINRGDCDEFAPGDSTDPDYGVLFREAISKGVEILPCRFEVSLEGISYLGLAKINLSSQQGP